jgi:hypothetical protein
LVVFEPVSFAVVFDVFEVPDDLSDEVVFSAVFETASVVVVSAGLFSDEEVVSLITGVPVVSDTIVISDSCGLRLTALRTESFFQMARPAMRTAATPDAIRILRLITIAWRFCSAIRSSALRKTLSETCL